LDTQSDIGPFTGRKPAGTELTIRFNSGSVARAEMDLGNAGAVNPNWIPDEGEHGSAIPSLKKPDHIVNLAV
jgi:hypothetical protein